MVVRLQVQDAEIRIGLLKAPQEDLCEVDHQEGQVGRIGHGSLFNVHKIFQAPILLGVAEVELNGLITNDKFCLTRRGQLKLTWWRRPLRLRK
jgi:hypothetical protein